MLASLQLCLDSTQLICAGELVVLRKCSYRSVATTLFLSERSVRRYCELYRLTGTVEPTKYRHGPKKLIIVIHMISNKPSKEIQEKLFYLTGTYVHVSTICRTVQYLGSLGRNYNTLHYSVMIIYEENVRIHVRIQVLSIRIEQKARTENTCDNITNHSYTKDQVTF